MDLLEKPIDCPYCGETIDLLIDPSILEQSYVEDCQVCCRPITVSVALSYDSNGAVILRVEVFHENE